MDFKTTQSWLAPIAVSVALVGATTAVLRSLEARLELDPLIFIYFIPTTYVALRYGTNAAMMATVMSCMAAAYFLYPPQHSFAVAGPLEFMQVVFFMLLAMLASQVVSGFIKDSSVERRRNKSEAYELTALRSKFTSLFGRMRSGN